MGQATIGSQMLDILIVDDQKTSQQFLKVCLEKEPELAIVGFASNGKEAIEQVEKLQPNVVIMDINMPVMDGLSATKIISERYTSTTVLIFSLYDDDESLSNAIEVGAKGYLLKNTPSDEIVLAIHSAHQGYFQLGPGLLERYLYRFSTNSKSSKEVNDKLIIASQIVEKHQHLNFIVDKMICNISRLEKNILLNRSFIYLLLIFNCFTLLLVLFNRA